MNIENLFKVKNIAIVGISENKGFGKDVWTNMSTYMTNTDNIYFVNPKGMRCLVENVINLYLI